MTRRKEIDIATFNPDRFYGYVTLKTQIEVEETIEGFRELFSWVLGMDNVLVCPTLKG